VGTLLTPNKKKILLINLFKVVSGVLVMVLILALMQLSGGLNSLYESFLAFGIKISGIDAFSGVIFILFLIAMFVLATTYLAVSNVKYKFLENKLIFTKKSFLLFTKTKNIPYQNISRVAFNDDGFFDGLFSIGTVILELSSMRQKEIELKFLDEPEKTAKVIQDVLRSFQLKSQAEYTEKYNIKKILNKGL
jgi:hypothetical protein|tara:strand:+ start:885 stop:1460 length:576 start_codon:yes stop_codon:yes gene_type:complete